MTASATAKRGFLTRLFGLAPNPAPPPAPAPKPLFVLAQQLQSDHRRAAVIEALRHTPAFLTPVPFGDTGCDAFREVQALAPPEALFRLGFQGLPVAARADYPTITLPMAWLGRSESVTFGHIGHPAWLAAWRALLAAHVDYLARTGRLRQLHSIKICPLPPSPNDMEFGTFWWNAVTKQDFSREWAEFGFTSATLPGFMAEVFAATAAIFPDLPVSVSFLDPHHITYGRPADAEASLARAILRAMKAREAYPGQLVVMNLTVNTERKESWAQRTARELGLGFAAQLGTKPRTPDDIRAATANMAALDPLWGEAHPFDLPAALAAWPRS